MRHPTTSITIATGLAMFSMFFGAGNVVFPLEMGLFAQSGNFWAMLGLSITAIAVPFIGVMTLALYGGSYDKFFERLGQPWGKLLILFCILLVGPFGATPRTVTVSYATISLYLPELSLPLFSAIACSIIFVMSWRLSAILDVLGYLLTPILVAALALMIAIGLYSPPEMSAAPASPTTLFFHGLWEGYFTMDLLAAFFFSHVVLLCLKKEAPVEVLKSPGQLALMMLRASLLGGLLLGAVYVGVSFLAAHYGAQYHQIPPEQLLGSIARDMLGSWGGVIACIAVSLACLTTAIALCSVFAEYLEKTVFKKKLSYTLCLAATVLATFGMSTLNFAGIASFLGPILQVIYPALIVLTLANLAHRLFGFSAVQGPVLLTTALSLFWFLFGG